MRRTLTALVIAMAVLPVPAAPASAREAVPIVVIDGKGFGHGVGMAQEGAFWMGAGGASTEQILGQFYPGTGYGRASGPVRVPVLDAGPAPSSGVLAFPDGGEVRENGTGPSSPGFPVRVRPGGQVRIVFDGGRYRVEAPAGGPVAAGGTRPVALGRPALIRSTRAQVPTVPTSSTTTTTTTAPPPEESTTTTTSSPPPAPVTSTTTTTSPTTTTTAPPPPAPAEEGPPPAPVPSSARSLVALPAGGTSVTVVARAQRYRGVIEATAAGGTLRFVNAVDVEDYLKGMGEVLDPRWPPAALRAQAIAARTYAMRAMATGGEICDTQRCQVYLGAQAEYGAMNRAVDDTRGRVVVFNRALISAVYSANGGGFSASREEGFGVTDGSVPYLRAAPYPTKDPGPWSVTVALRDVGARLGYPGTVTDVRISRLGPSQRALEVTLDGSAGPKAVTGLAFDASLGLRSTLFTLRVEAGEAPPPPPADEQVLQIPPEDAAAAAAAEVATTGTPATTAAPRDDTEAGGARGDGGGFDDGGDGRRHQLLVVSALVATALAGGAFIAARERVSAWWRTRRRPSPSAPRREGGTP